MTTHLTSTSTWLAALLVGVVATTTLAQPLRVGIGPTKVGKSLADDMKARGKMIEMGRVTEALDSHFTSAFTQTRKFEIVARTDLQDLVDRELGLPAGTVVDPETAAQSGKIKGLQDMVVISIDSFLDSRDVLDSPSLGIRSVKRRIQLSCQAKIYDCSSGTVLDALNVQHQLVDTIDIGKNESTSGERLDELMPKMAREMAEMIANRVVDVLYPLKVLDVDGKTVTLNRGDGAGLQAGQLWDVYGPGKVIVDEDTGKKIRTKGKKLGQVRITTVDPESAQGEIVSGTDVVAKSVLSRPAGVLPLGR